MSAPRNTWQCQHCMCECQDVKPETCPNCGKELQPSSSKSWNDSEDSSCTTFTVVSCDAEQYTVEPPNKGHFGAAMLSFVGRLSFSEVQNVLVLLERSFEECPLQRGRPFLEESFIGGSIVMHCLESRER